MDQRSRLLGAMTAIAGERGLREASVARVIERAGVSRATFYQLFEDRQACVAAAQERLIARVDAEFAESKTREADHRVEPTVGQADRAHAWAAALLNVLGAEPGVAGLLFRAALVNGPGSVERDLSAIDRWAAAVGSAVGRSRLGPGSSDEPYCASTSSGQTTTGPRRSGSSASATELISLGAAIAVARVPGATAADVARAARGIH